MTLSPRRAFAIAVLACAVAAPSIGNGFAYDDDAIIVNNPAVHGLAGVVRAFGASYWPAALGGSLYRPLPIALFALAALLRIEEFDPSVRLGCPDQSG